MSENLFGNELEKLRKLLKKKTGEKCTQRDIAERIGVTTQAYQNWMHGRRGKNMELETLKKLSCVLDCSFKRLVKLARPDIYRFCNELIETDTERKICKRVKCEVADDLLYLCEVLAELKKKEKKSFDRIRIMIDDLHPDIAVKVRNKRSG